MSTPAASAKSTRKKASKPPSGPAAKGKGGSDTKAAAGTTKKANTKKAGAGKAGAKAADGSRHEAGEHDVTITIPLDRAAHAAEKAVTMPIATVQRVLPAKGGLPLYAGLGALGLAGILEWPVAVGIGIGYAVLRRGGALGPAPAERAAAN
ncbi:hypothetical protein [Streptomyces meridianus]|uniref:Uncharacterized protein n=1 Tax=Streptomyces meridianus TaxID=2938945 RepID=A0ABT0XA40_9ACTN|nr:hypothetical protein [Streptomyces meridianus]MCM2579391.1 hypothetical protein [Streptomyces meridianus]